MSSLKQPPPSGYYYHYSYYRNKEIFHYFTLANIPYLILRCAALLFLFLSVSWLLLLLLCFPPTTTSPNDVVQGQVIDQNVDSTTESPYIVPTCDPSVSVYVYTLPAKFNLGLLSQCHNLSMKANMCPHIANSGLGQPLLHSDVEGSTTTARWFATHQYTAEIIFHARLENHPCRTWDPARATLFYVPFYGGLDALSKYHEANLTARDELSFSLVEFLQSQAWWQRRNGKDHFMALGTVAWDFMRSITNASSSEVHVANCLLNLPAAKNMSVLIIERHPWKPKQHGIPYPSYFHPSTWQDMVTWQNKMRLTERPHLFSFVGARRKNKAAIRNECIRQCAESTRCLFMNCAVPGGARRCLQPSEIMRVMTGSQFCLQAPGDTSTRRSTFDSVLAGCIPVFFSPHTAYTQYAWFLPVDMSTYSVYVDVKTLKSNASTKIEEELLKISSDKVKMMREKLIDLIPSLTYAQPNANNLGFGDAVDVALVSLAKHITS